MAFTPELDDRLERIARRVAEDREAGLTELTTLAEAGDKSAITFLGLYLSEVEETTEAALEWLLLASEFGSPDAAWNLAMIARERGEADEMKRWIDRAADLGEQDAKAVRANGYDVDAVLATYR
jgi:TPR repeat protein